MEWFKKHVDTIVVLGGILSSVLWMNHKFDQVEKDILVIKTVLVMQRIMPSELAQNSINHPVK